MAISLSEQLESDIKEYLHKTFGTYFSSLDERFAADIKKDVISASDFHHEHYNDDDISIAFQRVTLGRMGHPDWQIYHLCTDTEANTMKQNVKVNTPIHIRPASPEEAGLFYSELDETADERLGTVGHVRMDFGSSGKGFYHTPGGPTTMTSSTPRNSRVSFRKSWMCFGLMGRSRIWPR